MDVVVAHQGMPSSPANWETGNGTWSFYLKTNGGYSTKWIEDSTNNRYCVMANALATLKCNTVPNVPSNITSILTTPYIPGTIYREVACVVSSQCFTPGEYQTLKLSTTQSSEFGKISCLAETTWYQTPRTHVREDLSTTTWCLSVRGLPISIHTVGNNSIFPWATLTLKSVAYKTKPIDFSLILQP
jgi:hypothetical protein